MKIKFKPLAEQVVVITGASSGIGLAAARLAAERGARVVLVSRDDADLRSAVADIRAAGGTATHAVADVSDLDALRRAADHAVREYGAIDTWVNDAGVTIYGPVEQVPLEAAERLFRTNYWGVVHGSLAALPHLKRRGGALINVGSALSDTPIPLQVHYSASKHAVKGFTDGLRLELEHDKAPVSVTLIQPGAINTPYVEHAANYLGVEAKAVPPVYAPEVVARAILACAERPVRDLRVGGSAEAFALTEAFAARLGDKVKEATQVEGQKSEVPVLGDFEGTLFRAHPGDGRVDGSYDGHVMRSSAYTAARLNPGKVLLGAAAVGAGLFLAARQRNGRRDGAQRNAHTTHPTRRTTMADASQVREHMEVVGSDGQHVGTVDKVEGDRLKLTRNDPAAGGEHHYVSADLVQRVDGQVRLSQPADQVRQSWQAAG